MSITLDDLEELEAMSDFSASSDSEEAHSATGSDAGSGFDSESDGDSAESSDADDEDELDGGGDDSTSESDGDGDATMGSAGSGASGDGDWAQSSDDDNSEVRDSDSSEEGTDTAAQIVDDESIVRLNSMERDTGKVSADQAIHILAQTPFTRSEGEMEELLEWVLSVRFFQENARSSFVRDSPPARARLYLQFPAAVSSPALCGRCAGRYARR